MRSRKVAVFSIVEDKQLIQCRDFEEERLLNIFNIIEII